jgi:hypothetical protein
MVVMADSSARRLEDRLGNVLVKQGKIARERLDEALSVQKQTLQRLGHILVSGSAITSKDLRDALQVQVSQIVFRVFRWRDGRYLFAPSDTVDYDRENFASTDFILMEGSGWWTVAVIEEDPHLRHRVPAGGGHHLIDVAAGGAPTGAPRSAGRRQRDGRIRLGADEEQVFGGWMESYSAGHHRQHGDRRVRVSHPLRLLNRA